MYKPTAHTERHPSRRDPIEIGQRVRLHSGADAGTVEAFAETGRVWIRWDTGQSATWHANELVILAEQSA